jgi:glycosyltransferase involved in cell wall biosynthesis
MLYSTSPGPVAHLIAMKLATKYNIPWVADFRDPWAYASWTHKVRPMELLNMRLEKKVLARADRLIITLPKLINEFKTIEKKFNPARCSLILNGYDEEDFKDISPHIFEQFTIVYTGRLSHPRRSPYHLFDALSSLFQEFPDLKSKIRVVFTGRTSSSVTRLVKEYKLKDCVEMKGYLEHKKALSYICGASVLFLLAVETKGTGKPFQGKDVISLKLFEYLRAKRPILALVPEDSDSARIVQDTRSGVVVEPTDYQKAKKVILDMYEKYREGELKLRSNDSLIQKYERKVLTERLAEIFDDLLLKRERLKGAVK